MGGDEFSESPEQGEPRRGPDRALTRWLPSIFLGAAVLAGVTGAGIWLLDRPSSDAIEIFLPTPTAQPPPVVHVAGAVVSPGVYTLTSDSRVGDAIAAAGGALAQANVDGLNLAALVVDGERIDVPASLVPDAAPDTSGGLGATPGTQNPPDAAPGLVDLNSAGRLELESLPGIGPVRAQAIIDWRSANGPFESLDALQDVPGVGPETLVAIRGLVTPG